MITFLLLTLVTLWKFGKDEGDSRVFWSIIAVMLGLLYDTAILKLLFKLGI